MTVLAASVARRGEGESLWAAATMVGGVGVVTLTGRLGIDGITTCRTAVEQVLRRRPALMILDVRAVRVDGASVAMLGLMRRYAARRGTRVILACVPTDLARALHGARVADLYQAFPTLDVALAAAAGRPGSAQAAVAARRVVAAR